MPALAPLLPLDQLNPARFDAPAILKRLASSSRALAELKGIAASIPLPTARTSSSSSTAA